MHTWQKERGREQRWMIWYSSLQQDLLAVTFSLLSEHLQNMYCCLLLNLQQNEIVHTGLNMCGSCLHCAALHRCSSSTSWAWQQHCCSSSLCLLAASKPTPKVHSITYCVRMLQLAFLLSIVLYHISSVVQSVCFQQQQFPSNQLWWTHCSLPAQHQNSRQTQRETRCDEESISSQIFSSGSGGDQTRSKRRLNIWNKHDSSVSLWQLLFLENLFFKATISQFCVWVLFWSSSASLWSKMITEHFLQLYPLSQSFSAVTSLQAYKYRS